MSFWKSIGFSAPVASIDSILDAHTAAIATLRDEPNRQQLEIIAANTLDKLLAHSDLLSEVKTGNTRLNDLLATAEVLQRLAGWIVWGLGDGLIGGIVQDGVMDGPVMITSMGGVPKRRDMDQFGVLEGEEPETVEEKASAG